MSYRNPKQVVDTQSGQYVREMQQSLSNTTNKTIQGLSNIYLENQKQIKEIANEAAEATTKIENAVFQTKSKNSTIQFDSLNGQLNKFSNLKKQDPTKLTNKQRNFMRSMENIGTTMKNGLANTTASAISFKEQTDKGLGKDGGNDEFRNPKQYKVMSIMNGSIPGSKEANYEEDELGNVIYSVVVKDANGVPVGKVINGNIEQTMFVSKVPDLIQKKAKAIELVNAKLSLDSKFADAYKRGDTFGPNGEGQKVNADDFEKGVAAQADNIQREMSDNDLASYWNNIIRPKTRLLTQEDINANPNKYENKKVGDEIKNDKLWDYDVELTTEQRKTFGEAFTKDILGELGAVRAANKIMQTKTVKEGNGKTIVRDFSKSVKEGVKNITPSKGVTFVLESTISDNPSIYYTNPITKKISPDPKAKYVYTPAGGDVGGVPIEVNYWKKIPKDPNDPTKGYKVGEYEVNYEGIMSTLGSNLRKL
tara:strand:+ start:1408 stop:2844 length:1437 start_codon:yes stop_codon:yes gene_type:complete